MHDGADGYLFDPDARSGDSSMRTLVEDLVVSRDLRLRMGESGRRAVRATTWNSVCTELLGHYRHVIAARRPVPVVEAV